MRQLLHSFFRNKPWGKVTLSWNVLHFITLKVAYPFLLIHLRLSDNKLGYSFSQPDIHTYMYNVVLINEYITFTAIQPKRALQTLNHTL